MINLAVINLPRRTDRREHMEEQLRRLRKYVTWFDGQPGGRFGCAQAHVNVLKWVLETGEPTIILEDDVILNPGFDEYLPHKVPLYLGGEWVGYEWKSLVGRVATHPHNIHRSHAYAVNPEIAQIILDTPLSKDGHYDHSLGKLFPYVEVVHPFPVKLAKMGSDVSR